MHPPAPWRSLEGEEHGPDSVLRGLRGQHVLARVEDERGLLVAAPHIDLVLDAPAPKGDPPELRELARGGGVAPLTSGRHVVGLPEVHAQE
eukprot:15434736-Alexandrium_andersonii.AAC.1